MDAEISNQISSSGGGDDRDQFVWSGNGCFLKKETFFTKKMDGIQRIE
jgi:hypothetical protein